jgi:hypothetical protein
MLQGTSDCKLSWLPRDGDVRVPLLSRIVELCCAGTL